MNVLGIFGVPVSKEDLGQLVLESDITGRDVCLVECETQSSCVIPVVC